MFQVQKPGFSIREIKWNKFLSAATITVFLLGLSACGGSKKEENIQAKKDSLKIKTYSVNPDKVIGIGRVEPETKFVKLYPEVAGMVDGLFIKSGQEVKRGQLLVALSSTVEAGRIEKAKAQVASQEEQVKSQNAQIRAQETQVQTQQTQINGFEKEIAKARIAVGYAQKNFDRIAKVFNEGAETKATYDNAENQLQSAQAEVERLIAQQNNLKAQQDNLKAQVEIQKAQKTSLSAKVNEFKADVSISEAEKDKRNVYAPVDGKILSVEVTPGAYISPQTVIGEFAPASPVNVVCEIDEMFAEKMTTGQKAVIHLQGSKEMLAEGEVIEVAPYLKQKSLFSDEVGKLEDRRVREVRIRLSNPPANLLYGSRVDCEIKLK
ncbi:MAG: efflux RND transporter periplasmic adaptor subunit [Bacteroidia bacterium]|nr:efflux RND transporter periplasmic adaptor subunit [Bacteroidia bacterium]